MERVQIFCEAIIKGGSAFGVRTDTGEGLFIPLSLVQASKLSEGEIAEAVLVPNTRKGAATDWFAIKVYRSERPEPPPPVMSVDDRALHFIREADTFYTTTEVAAEIKTDTTIAHTALLRLFNQGKIAKADVYASGGQSRPSFCLWASSAKIFLGEEE